MLHSVWHFVHDNRTYNESVHQPLQSVAEWVPMLFLKETISMRGFRHQLNIPKNIPLIFKNMVASNSWSLINSVWPVRISFAIRHNRSNFATESTLKRKPMYLSRVTWRQHLLESRSSIPLEFSLWALCARPACEQHPGFLRVSNYKFNRFFNPKINIPDKWNAIPSTSAIRIAILNTGETTLVMLRWKLCDGNFNWYHANLLPNFIVLGRTLSTSATFFADDNIGANEAINAHTF